MKLLSLATLLVSASVGLGLPSSSALAQTGNKPAGDEVVTLPEFGVQATVDGGYDAADSLTGSRVRTVIRELPYNVNVVTAEFIRDFAAFDINEELAYTSSFAPGQSTDLDYSLRGITVNGQLRNGFRVEAARGSLSTARVEVIKGPSAAVYGQSAPGGAVNTITKRPKTKTEARMSFSGGSYNTRRSELEFTGPVPGTSADKGGWLRDTYYLFAVADYYREYEIDFAFDHQWQAAFTVLKKFGPDTSLTLETEYIIQHYLRELPLPYNQESVGGRTVSTGLAYDLKGFYTGSPDDTYWRRQGAAFLTFEHRFNRTLSLRVAANHTQAQQWTNAYIGFDTAQFNPRRITGREPQNNVSGRYVSGVQSDLAASYRAGGMEHRSLFTFDYANQRSTRSTTRLQNSSAILNNPAFNVPTLLPAAPNYFLRRWTPAAYPRVSNANDNLTEIYGMLLRHQVSAWQGRLLALLAVRYDYVGFDLKDKRNLNAIVSDVYHNEAVTKQFGINYKITEPVLVYLNAAESFVPPTSSGTTAINTGRRFENERGHGYEAGVKLSLFDGRLVTTIGTFRIERRAVRITEVETTPVLDAQGRPVINPATGEPRTITENVDRSAGLEKSNGAEIDFSWKVNRTLQLFGGYGFADSYIEDAGRDLDAVGRRPRSVPEHQGGMGARITPAGAWKGVTFTAGVTYMGDSYTQSPLSGGTVGTDGYIRIHNGRRDVKAPGYTVWNAGASYRFRSGALSNRPLQHRVQLNVKNLLDLNYIDSRFRAAARLTLIGGYGLTF